MIKPTFQEARDYLASLDLVLSRLGSEYMVEYLGRNKRRTYTSLYKAIVYSYGGYEREAEANFERWLIKHRGWG